MKVYVVQKDINHTDLKPYLAAAMKHGADLVCFGELATSGCLTAPVEVPSLDSVCGLFQEFDFRIVTGLPVSTPEGLHNACLYNHGDSYQIYRKINLFPPFDEPDIYLPGKDIGVWETDLGKVGVAICYDIRFDDIFQHLKAHQVRLIFIPAAFPRVRISDWRNLLRRRAGETNAYVIGINAVGSDAKHEFGGRSAIINPKGKVIAEADEVSETTLEADLPL